MSAANNDAASRLLAQLRNGRRRTVEVEPGKTLIYLRPTEEQILQFAARKVSALDLARSGLQGWQGVTEADLLGPEIGSSDPAPFSPEIGAEVLADRAATWQHELVQHLVQQVEAFLAQRAEQRKNSSPSLTPSAAPGTATSPSETSTTNSPSAPGTF